MSVPSIAYELDRLVWVDHGRVTLTVTEAVAPGTLDDLHGVMPFEDADEMREIVEREFESVDSRDHRVDFP